MRTGAPWQNLPKEHGDWNNTHRRFTRWRDKGIWEKILKLVMDESDLSNIMMTRRSSNATWTRVAQKVKIKAWRTHKMGLNMRVHVVVDTHRLLLQILTFDENVNDSQKAEELIRDFEADYLMEDRGYDSKTIVEVVRNNGMNVVIPFRSNAKNPRSYDKELYTRRHLIENFFLRIKRFRSISTRYTKNISSFMAYLAIASIMTYCKLL